ncbi:hypothetical protein [Schaalia sp. ZJ405]|nr:hypothetical protein [Schaalia sp. ZJ405]
MSATIATTAKKPTANSTVTAPSSKAQWRGLGLVGSISDSLPLFTTR